MIGEETFHPDIRALLAYGRALTGQGPAPRRGGADQVLERIFVIERTRDGRLPIRSFGAELVALFGRDLRHHDLARFFPPHDFAMLSAFIGACADAGAPGVARVSAESACGLAMSAELLITPLKFDDALGNRYLGLFQSLGDAENLEGRPVQILRLCSLHPPLSKTQRGVRLVVVNG